jgi:hypothetical protein
MTSPFDLYDNSQSQSLLMETNTQDDEELLVMSQRFNSNRNTILERNTANELRSSAPDLFDEDRMPYASQTPSQNSCQLFSMDLNTQPLNLLTNNFQSEHEIFSQLNDDEFVSQSQQDLLDPSWPSGPSSQQQSMMHSLTEGDPQQRGQYMLDNSMDNNNSQDDDMELLQMSQNELRQMAIGLPPSAQPSSSNLTQATLASLAPAVDHMEETRREEEIAQNRIDMLMRQDELYARRLQQQEARQEINVPLLPRPRLLTFTPTLSSQYDFSLPPTDGRTFIEGSTSDGRCFYFPRKDSVRLASCFLVIEAVIIINSYL